MAREPFLRVITDDAGIGAAGEPLISRKMRAKRKRDFLDGSADPVRDRREREAQQSFHFGAERIPMLFRQGESTVRATAWRGVRIRAAADGDERDRARMVALDGFLRVAGPVAAN